MTTLQVVLCVVLCAAIVWTVIHRRAGRALISNPETDPGEPQDEGSVVILILCFGIAAFLFWLFDWL